MTSPKLIIYALISLFIVTLALSSCSSGKYCVGGKSKYKRMKQDTGMMVF